LVLHGSGESAQNNYAPIFGAYAAENDVILILPQAKDGWPYDGLYDEETGESAGIGNDPTFDLQYTQKGRVMAFMR
jgi:hypothetical protein